MILSDRLTNIKDIAHKASSRPIRPRITSTPRAVSSSSPGSNEKAKKSRRRTTSLPSNTVEYLKSWMMSPEHIAHPYPTEQEKLQIMNDTGIELKQLTNWFVNNRKRYWKPRVEARLKNIQLQMSAAATSSSSGDFPSVVAGRSLNTPSPSAASVVQDSLMSTILTPHLTSFYSEGGLTRGIGMSRLISSQSPQQTLFQVNQSHAVSVSDSSQTSESESSCNENDSLDSPPHTISFEEESSRKTFSAPISRREELADPIVATASILQTLRYRLE